MTGSKNATKSRLSKADDAPEATEAWFAGADLYKGGKLVRRGRPKGSGTKELISLRLDKEALAIYRATGPGWQVRLNEVMIRSAKRMQAK